MSKHPIIAILALLACAASAPAQCVPQWSTLGTDTGALAFTVWDQDGAGPARPVLVAGGSLRSAGGPPLNLIGTYDGRVWRPIGEGLGTEGTVYAVCAASTTGVGSPAPGVYAGGNYRFVGEPLRFLSHWDGSTWRDLPELRGLIWSLFLFDEDGPGPNEPSLFVGGGIAEIAGVAWPGLARWDGASFSLIGGSLQPEPLGSCYVLAMTIFDDDGAGPRPPALYVAGSFQTASGLVVNNIARWDGQNWEALGLGLAGGVEALAVFDADGDGPELPMLYTSARYRTPTGTSSINLSRWDGKEWTHVPDYDGGGVYSLHVFDDDGDGPNKPALFVGGLFSRVNRVFSPGVIKWDGQQWLALDGGVGGVTGAAPDAMGTFDEDNDPATPAGLFMGGSFLTAGSLWAPGLARWGCEYPACYADCDRSTGNEVLDLFDFLCFQNDFVTGNSYACDCDTSTGPLVCDMLDFLCFQSAFLAGCP